MGEGFDFTGAGAWGYGDTADLSFDAGSSSMGYDAPTLSVASGYASGSMTPGYDATSGALQAMAALGYGYAARRLDIDIASRAQQALNPQMSSTQRPIDATTRGVSALGSMRIGDLLPIVGLGLLAWAAMR